MEAAEDMGETVPDEDRQWWRLWNSIRCRGWRVQLQSSSWDWWFGFSSGAVIQISNTDTQYDLLLRSLRIVAPMCHPSGAAVRKDTATGGHRLDGRGPAPAWCWEAVLSHTAYQWAPSSLKHWVFIQNEKNNKFGLLSSCEFKSAALAMIF